MKNSLKTLGTVAAMGLLLGGGAAYAKAPICINTQDIISSTPNKDGSAIDFKMRDGKVWRNTLQSRCPDLRFNGFAWVIHGPTIVCENQQSFRVLQSPEICMLGKFTLLPPKPKETKSQGG